MPTSFCKTNKFSIVSYFDEAMHANAVEKLDLVKEICSRAQNTKCLFGNCLFLVAYLQNAR